MTDGSITLVLQRIEQGDPHAAEQLLPLVYEELRRLAAASLAQDSSGLTLQPTALVHEAWLHLGGEAQSQWSSRGQFFTAAGEAMRRIRIDHAREKRALRDGGEPAAGSTHATGFAAAVRDSDDEHLLVVHEALTALAAHEPRLADLVKQKYFAGLTLDEAAEVQGVSRRMVARDWAYARAWLFNEVQRLRP